VKEVPVAVNKGVMSGSKTKAPKETSAKPIRKTVAVPGKLGQIAPLEVSGFKLAAPRRAAKVTTQTIEQRLGAKANIADTKVFATRRLGQMSRDERRELLFG